MASQTRSLFSSQRGSFAKLLDEKHHATIKTLVTEISQRSSKVKDGEACNFDYIMEGNSPQLNSAILSHIVANYGGVVHDCVDSMGSLVVCMDAWQCVASVTVVRAERWKLVRKSGERCCMHLVWKSVVSFNFHALGAKSGRSLRSCVA
eukprot:3749495-Rhodomonas_salina.1